jgi:hypothetical protein
MNAQKVMNASLKRDSAKRLLTSRFFVNHPHWPPIFLLVQFRFFSKIHQCVHKILKMFFCVDEGAQAMLRILFNLTKINRFLGAFFMYVSGTFSTVNCTLYRVWYENTLCSSLLLTLESLSYRGEPARVEPGREPLQQVPHGRSEEPTEPSNSQSRDEPSIRILDVRFF